MKTFNRVISLVTVAVFVLSMMITPAFAAGLNGFQTPTGNEKLIVTYYSDAALTNAITTAKTGDTVYAKVTVNVPTKTLSSLTANVKVENATIENDDTTVFSSLADFERPVLPGTNVINADKVSANLQINKKTTGVFDSPVNYEEIMEKWSNIDYYTYKNIEIDTFDATVYTLNVTGTTGEVAFSFEGKSGIGIGEFSEDDEDMVLSALGIDGKLTISSGTSTTKKVTYTVEFDETKEYDSTLSEDDLKAAIKADIKIKKSIDGAAAAEISNDDVDITIDTTAKTINIDFTKNVAEGEELAAGQDAEKNLTYKVAAPAPTPTYVLKTVYFDGKKIDPTFSGFNADYTSNKEDADLKAGFAVYMEKFVGEDSQGDVPATSEDYEVAVTKSTIANEATVTITFKGKLAGTTAKTYTVTYTDVPEKYSDVKAELTTTEFANNTPADTVKAAVKVTAKKTQGVLVTDGVVMALNTDYSVSIDSVVEPLTTGSYTATVTLEGKLAGLALTPADGKFTFDVVADTIEYDNYSAEFEGGGTEFLATATDAEIASKITVKADKKVNGSVVGNEVVAPANYDVTINRTTGTVTITFKTGTLYEGGSVSVPTITFRDVIEHKNITTTMTTRMFAADASVDAIKAAVVVTGEVWKNGEKDADKTYVLDTDYNVEVDTANKKVTVKFIGDLAENPEKEFEIAIGVTATAEVTLGGTTVNLGDKLTGTISVGGTTETVYAAEITLEVTKGDVTLAPATGYQALAGSTATKITVVRIPGSAATNDIATFAIDTTSLAKDDVIEVTVKDLKLTTVDGDDVKNMPSFTGEAKASATVTETAPATTKISAEFEIKTLGDVATAADRFVNGLKVTKGDVDVDATGKVTVVGKKLKLTDLEVGAGTYKVAVNVPGYTKAEVEIVVAADMTVTGGTTGKEAIYAGDVNADGNIDAADYADLVAQYGKAASDKYDLYVADADTNINVNDIITMVYEFETYFGKTITTSGIIAE